LLWALPYSVLSNWPSGDLFLATKLRQSTLPLDEGIIPTFKTLYKSEMLSEGVKAYDNFDEAKLKRGNANSFGIISSNFLLLRLKRVVKTFALAVQQTF
jgi:hypothetical protein